MLTLNQFLTYCSRNNIQTVAYAFMYNVFDDFGNDKFNFLPYMIRKDESYVCGAYEVQQSYLSPFDFYNWYVHNGKYNACNLVDEVRRHMRSKCTPRAIFDSDDLPF